VIMNVLSMGVPVRVIVPVVPVSRPSLLPPLRNLTQLALLRMIRTGLPKKVAGSNEDLILKCHRIRMIRSERKNR